MEKFWEWMIKMGYELNSCPSKEVHSIHNPEFNTSVRPTKQMLIGYMIEYLRTKGMFIGLSSVNGFETIESYYESLEKKINGL